MLLENTASVNEDNRVIIESLDDYIVSINEIRRQLKEDQGEDIDNQHFFFRGQANEDWDVAPGIFRGDLLPFEAELMQMACLRNPHDFRNLGSTFEKLTKLQHYGLPTRLLDVTSNPLVALYFACQPHKELQIDVENNFREFYVETDGAVYFQRAYCKGYDEQETKIIAHVAGMGLRGDITLEELLESLEEHNIYSTKAAQMCREKNYRSLIETLQSNYFVVSNLNNERLIRQSGAFLLCGQYNIIVDEEKMGNSFLQKANGSLRSEFNEEYYYIPCERKQTILDELDFYNINEGTLFPELEHQMTYIKNSQAGRSAQTIGRFSKVFIEEAVEAAQVTQLDEIDEDRVLKAVNEVLQSKIQSGIQQECLEILRSNMKIDWYRKENVQSKMRLELAKALEISDYYDRISAKKKANEIIEGIISMLL